MKKSTQNTSAKQSPTKVDPIQSKVDSELPPSQRPSSGNVNVLHGDVRAAVSRQLHDLLNSLWPVAARIELTITDESCPQEFREMLAQLGRCVEEAMTIASNASELINSATSDRNR